MDISSEVKAFFDADGILKQMPSKFSKQKIVIDWIASHIEEDKEYTEHEINMVINGLHTFNDATGIRRSLIEHKWLNRTPDGKKYWKLNKG